MTTLADLTTLRVGGPIARVVPATSSDALVDAVAAADAAGGPLLVVGGGSNLLASDAPFEGTVIDVQPFGEVASIIEDARAWYGADIDPGRLGAAWERLVRLPSWIPSYCGALADAAALKNLTSQLIGRFVSAVAAATRDVFGSGALTRYGADLIIPDETAAEILVLKGAAVHYVMAPREHEPVYLRQRTELFDLADILLSSGSGHLEPIFAAAWRRAGDEAGRTRAVVDQIASLTDTSARAWHARLCGLLSRV